MSFLHYLLFTSLFLSFVYDSHVDNIGNVCPKTKNPPLCDKVLRSSPDASGADYNDLCRIAIDKAVGATMGAKNLVSSLIGQTRDPVLTNRYNSSLKSFNEAVQRLNSVRQLLGSKDYNNLVDYASIAYNVGVDCDRLLGSPPSESLQLKNAGKQSQDYNSLVCFSHCSLM
ncbi:hypothetical protein LIER_26731 [Lithospermum erythrorhizon]|uniref:Pectinesterase inhibitor domain-containing protein n=1 Tax=Lithospermum erythrorhizon TaxID=34254 RepID=A0AAV3RD33_LITER